LRTVEVVYEWFVADGAAVLAAFPGWLSPRALPVRRLMTNPFTGKTVVSSSGEPLMELSYFPDETFGTKVECPSLSQFAPTNLWPIGSLELPALAEALGLPAGTVARDALFAPPSFGWSLHVLPDSLVEALLRPHDAAVVVSGWCQALREYHPGELDICALVHDWTAVLQTLSALAARARAENQRLYIYAGCCTPDRQTI
jgi:hypothetical protein